MLTVASSERRVVACSPPATGGGAHRCVATTTTVGRTRHSDACCIVTGRCRAAVRGAQNDNTTCGRSFLSRLRSQANVAKVDWRRAHSARQTATAVNELINYLLVAGYDRATGCLTTVSEGTRRRDTLALLDGQVAMACTQARRGDALRCATAVYDCAAA